MSTAINGEDAFSAILDWAQAKGQTAEQLKEANDTLNRIVSELPRPSDAMVADRERVRRIILEEEPPSNSRNELAFFLNRLPGEQKRALRSLDILAAQSQQYARAIEGLVGDTSLQEPYGANRADQLRNDLRTAPWSSLYPMHPRMFEHDSFRYMFRTASQLADAAVTSFLVASEFENGGVLRHLLIEWTDFITRARALSMQLALIAYKLDHGSYPETLDALVPDYLPKMIHDPYSGEAFQYRPEGLNLPLTFIDHYDANPRHAEIAAGTPLLWSVGLGNNALKEFVDNGPHTSYGMRGEFEGSAPASEMIEPQENVGRQVMGFEPTEGIKRGGMRYVFPLPKLEREPADPDSTARP